MMTENTLVDINMDNGDGKIQASWKKTLDKVTKAVVAIKKRATISFDGNGASCSQATGFVVDKANGIILTNRHVVGTGPSMVEVMFLNKEEIPVIPVYRDPVHDFGFYRFNPKDLEFMDLEELQLNPEGAVIGADIRVVGNDSGEKLSILSGTIARLDRAAPEYFGAYTDFNTFYLGAASSTSGGSSGSPVVNIKGEVIGLNAGGKPTSASSYYLPLFRVVRALKYIQGKQPVPRGTLQTIFKHTDFNELKRLGLKKDEEMVFRKHFAKESISGLLVVHHVVVGGTGEAAGLEPGDILLEIGGEKLHTFVQMEQSLDDRAEEVWNHDSSCDEGKIQIALKVRRGDKTEALNAEVQDLHSVLPDQFLMIAGGVLHPLSYMLARKYNVPAGAVFTASQNLMFLEAGIPNGSIVKSVNSAPTPDIEAFIAEMLKYKDGDKLLVKYSLMSSPSRVLVGTVLFEGRFFVPMRRAFRNDEDGLFHFEDVVPANSLESARASGTRSLALAATERNFAKKEKEKENMEMEMEDQVAAAMVMVKFMAPYLMDGMDGHSFMGTGFIIDAEQGYVVCSRSVVPCSLGNVLLSVASELQVRAQVVYIHPMLTFSVLKFDPYHPDVLSSAIELRELKLSPANLKTLDKSTFIGLTGRETRIRVNESTVSYVTHIPASEHWPPMYYPKNQQVYKVDKVSSSSSKGGVFVDQAGAVQAFFWEYSSKNYAAFPAHQVFNDVTTTLQAMKGQSSVELDYKTLGLSITSKPISKVKDAYKVSAERLDLLKKRIKEKKLDRKHILAVSRVMTSYPPADVLEIGDIILNINNVPVADVEDVEDQVKGKSKVTMTIQRNQEEKTVDVVTASLPIAGTSQIVSFSGLSIQPIFPHVAFSSFMPEGAEHGGVFIVRRMSGSPADQSRIPTNVWITHVNDNPVKDIDAFLQVVTKLEDKSDTRIKIVTRQGVTRAYTLKTDFHYFGTRLLERKLGTTEWTNQIISKEE